MKKILEKLRSILIPILHVMAWFVSIIFFMASIGNRETPTWLLGGFIAGLIIFPPFDKFLKSKNIQIPFWGKIIIFLIGASIAGSVDTKEQILQKIEAVNNLEKEK
jgi:hypothetical protein